MNIPSENPNILLHNTKNGANKFHVNLTETTREKNLDSSAGEHISHVKMNKCSVEDYVKEIFQLCLDVNALFVDGRAL